MVVKGPWGCWRRAENTESRTNKTSSSSSMKRRSTSSCGRPTKSGRQEMCCLMKRSAKIRSSEDELFTSASNDDRCSTSQKFLASRPTYRLTGFSLASEEEPLLPSPSPTGFLRFFIRGFCSSLILSPCASGKLCAPSVGTDRAPVLPSSSISPSVPRERSRLRRCMGSCPAFRP